MAETKVTEVKAEGEATTKKVVAKLKAKNISSQILYLTKGIVQPGDSIEVTSSELSCFEGKYLEKV